MFTKIKNRLAFVANFSLLSEEKSAALLEHIQLSTAQWVNAGFEVVVVGLYDASCSKPKRLVSQGVLYNWIDSASNPLISMASIIHDLLLNTKPCAVLSAVDANDNHVIAQLCSKLSLVWLADFRFDNPGDRDVFTADFRPHAILTSEEIASLTAPAILWPLSQPQIPNSLLEFMPRDGVVSFFDQAHLQLSAKLQLPQESAVDLLSGIGSDKWVPIDDQLNWVKADVEPLSKVAIWGAVDYHNTGTELSRKALILLKLYDEKAQQITTATAGLSWSEKFNCHFVYLPDSNKQDKQICAWVVPEHVVGFDCTVRGFYLKAAETVKVKAVRFYSDNKQTLVQEQWNMIKHHFYNKGEITFTRTRLERLLKQEMSSEQTKLAAEVMGMYQLKQGIAVPQREANPLYLVDSHSLLYCLHQSLPYFTNGYATRSHGIARGLNSAGWRVNAVTRPGFPWDSLDVLASYRQHTECYDGVEYTAWKGETIEQPNLYQYIEQSVEYYCEQARRCRARIIIAASNHVTALPALIAARKLGIPFVYELRGLWHFTKGSLRPDWANSERFNLEHELELQIAREADHLFTLTTELHQTLRQSSVLTEVSLAPNAVDCSLFSPCEKNAEIISRLAIPAGQPVIGYAGSAVGYEGLDVLMDALAILSKQGSAFVFVLLGDGEVLEQVKQKAKLLGIAKHCRFAGRVAFADVASYLSCMDILPIPRRSNMVTERVSALKPLEAMAMAKTLVLSNVSPHYDFAGQFVETLDSDTGVELHERALLCRHDDARSLASALKLALSDPALRLNLGQAALAWVTAERSWQAVTRRYSNTLAGVALANNMNNRVAHNSCDFWLLLPELTELGVKAILKQSLRPSVVLALSFHNSTPQKLLAHGIVTGLPIEVATSDVFLLQVRDVAALFIANRDAFYDLYNASQYYKKGPVAFSKSPLATIENTQDQYTFEGIPDLSMLACTLKADAISKESASALFLAVARYTKQGLCLLLNKPLKETKPVVLSKASVLLIAGHDLKFITPFYPAFEQAGFRVVVDQWLGHEQHDEVKSLALLKEADIIFCEWLLGNAIWYARNKLPSQVLVGRLHAQELRSPLLKKLPISAFSKIFCVAKHVQQEFKKHHPSSVTRLEFVPNALDLERFSFQRKTTANTFKIALVGAVPKSKRLDRALDIISELRAKDPRWQLVVKGKNYQEYPWLMRNSDERAWFETQHARIAQDKNLTDGVQFVGFDDDMPGFYQGVNYILSVSDHESFHFSVAEGAASGCTPIVFDWPGAASTYPGDWIVNSVAEACEKILKQTTCASSDYRNWIVSHYNLAEISKQLSTQLNSLLPVTSGE